MNGPRYIPVPESVIPFLTYFPMHYEAVIDGTSRFALYNREEGSFSEERLAKGTYPKLYVSSEDRRGAIRLIQQGLSRQLQEDAESKNPVEIKKTLKSIMEGTLTAQDEKSPEISSKNMGTLVCHYLKKYDVVRDFLMHSAEYYRTVMESIYTIPYAFDFAIHKDRRLPYIRKICLCSLLYNIGETRIDQDILTPGRRLDPEDIEKLKTHTTGGYEILSEHDFGCKDVALAALQHHERVDGTGYPQGITEISEIAQVLGIIDDFRELTDGEKQMGALPALQSIMEDVNKGRYNKQIFKTFVLSLGPMN